MHNQVPVYIRDPIKFMNGLMFFTKLFKQSDRKYFMIANNRLFTIHPYSVYPDPTDYFNAEIDVTIPIAATYGDIDSGFQTDEKSSKDLNGYIKECFDCGLMFNTLSVTRILIDVDTFYNLYKSLKDDKKLNLVQSIVITASSEDYIGYDKLTINGPDDVILYESTKYEPSLTSKVPRVINFMSSGQNPYDMYGTSYQYVSNLRIDSKMEEEIYFGEKPVDAIIGENIVPYCDISAIASKRCFLSKNIVPKEFAKCIGTPLSISLYKFTGDNKTYIMRLSKLILSRMILSSDFKTIFV